MWTVPIELSLMFVNHMLPSAPGAMPWGLMMFELWINRIEPVGVIRPTVGASCPDAPNHRLPSGPAAMS